MRPISKIADFGGKRVLIRVDWNVPFDRENGAVTDDTRIAVSIPTIEYVKKHGGVPIVASHFGREGDSIGPVIDYAKKNFPVLAEGVEFLENLRANRGEESNGDDFARDLASKAGIFVNEAFSVSHREHSSIVGVPKYLPSYVGFRFAEEVNKLSEAFNPEHPFLFILGGAKFETKLPLVTKFLEIADSIFIGGALARAASEMDIAKNPKIIFPVGDTSAFDANDETLQVIESKVESSKFVLWNGPLGKYEDGYKEGTLRLARILSQSAGKKVIVGGGDTENVIDELDIENKFYFISLAGGAMLDFLATGTLPGIEALQDSSKNSSLV